MNLCEKSDSHASKWSGILIYGQPSVKVSMVVALTGVFPGVFMNGMTMVSTRWESSYHLY